MQNGVLCSVQWAHPLSAIAIPPPHLIHSYLYDNLNTRLICIFREIRENPWKPSALDRDRVDKPAQLAERNEQWN